MNAALILLLALPSWRAGAAQAVAAPEAVRPVVPIAPLRFDWTQPQALEHYQAARDDFYAAVRAVGAIPPPERTFENTVGALEDARARLDERVAPAGFLGLVSPDPAVRAALTGHLVPVLAREEDAYRAVQELERLGRPVEGADRLLLQEMKRDFRLDGKGLDAAKMDRMQKLLVRLRELENYFGQNVWNDRPVVFASPEEQAGLPDALLAGLLRMPDGSVEIPVNLPTDYRPVMSQARSPELRRRAELVHARVGAYYNVGYVDEALTLRAEQAKLLGSPSYAHLAMESRSMKSPWSAARFLRGVARALIPAVRREDEQLLELKRRDEPGASRLESWDVEYYTRRLLESHGFDLERARSFFPAEPTIAAVLRRLEAALGVRFVEQAAQAWHPSVRLYAVEDADGRRLASFYLDAYEREGKNGSRFVQPLARGRVLPDGSTREPLFAVVLNFASAASGKAAGLSHEELVGLLHELGHALDDALTGARYARFAGGAFGSGLDRAEVPSQLVEQLAWSPEFLASISARDGDPARPIPAELLNAMLAYGNVGRARTILTWAARAAVDLALHSLRPPKDVARLIDRIFVRFGLRPPPAGHAYQASFGHLMGPYAAGYYTYLTSLNRALDLYSRVGPAFADPAAGRDYRREILAPGGERDMDEAARAFLGRDPDPRALERFLSRF